MQHISLTFYIACHFRSILQSVIAKLGTSVNAAGKSPHVGEIALGETAAEFDGQAAGKGFYNLFSHMQLGLCPPAPARRYERHRVGPI